MIDRFEQFVSYISAIHRDIQKIERDEMEKYGLKGAHAQYLVAMHRYPAGITATELCDVCGKDKAAVSRALNEMEKHELIARAGNQENQYRVHMKLTEKGLEAADYVCRKAVMAVQIAAEGIDDATRAIMYKSLRSIASHVQMISEKGLPD